MRGSLVPMLTIKQVSNGFRNKLANGRIRVAIAKLGLLIVVRPVRNYQVEDVLGPGHGHIQQPAFFLYFFGTGRHARRNTSVHYIQNSDIAPFLALGRVNGRKDRVVLLDWPCPTAATCCVRGIKGQFGEKPLTRGVPGSDLL
jgi:hypothetical protein